MDGFVECSESSDSSEYRVVVVGKTGVGKSSAANMMLKKYVFNVQIGAESVTDTSEKSQEPVTIDNKQIYIVDTPGLFDTRKTIMETSNEIGRCVKLLTPGPHVFIYVVSITHRYTNEDINTIKELKETFGEGLVRYMIIVFTHKDSLHNRSCEQYIQTASKELRDIIRECDDRCVFVNTTARDDNDVSSILDLIVKLIETNKQGYYTNKMFKEASRELADKKRKEEELIHNRQEIKTLVTQLEEKSKDIYELKNKIDILHVANRSLTETKESLNETIGILSSKLTNLESDKSELIKEKGELKSDIRVLKLEKNNLTAKLKRKRKKNSAVQKASEMKTCSSWHSNILKCSGGIVATVGGIVGIAMPLVWVTAAMAGSVVAYIHRLYKDMEHRNDARNKIAKIFNSE